MENVTVEEAKHMVLRHVTSDRKIHMTGIYLRI